MNLRDRNRKRRKRNSGAPSWMVTYSDMVTLILVFFILLFAMSQIDNAKFQAVTDSFRNRSIFFEMNSSIIPLDAPPNGENGQKDGGMEDLQEIKKNADAYKKAKKREDDLDKLMADVKTYLNEHNLQRVVSATRSDRGVELILQESILFKSGDADILNSGKPFLDKIGQMLAKLPNYVRVEGHTDNRPISNYRYPSNWELSGARASSVIRYLIEKDGLEPYRLSAVGYGDTKPLVPNDSPQNWSKNRRVEIVVLDTKESQQNQR